MTQTCCKFQWQKWQCQGDTSAKEKQCQPSQAWELDIIDNKLEYGHTLKQKHQFASEDLHHPLDPCWAVFWSMDALIEASVFCNWTIPLTIFALTANQGRIFAACLKKAFMLLHYPTKTLQIFSDLNILNVCWPWQQSDSEMKNRMLTIISVTLWQIAQAKGRASAPGCQHSHMCTRKWHDHRLVNCHA